MQQETYYTLAAAATLFGLLAQYLIRPVYRFFSGINTQLIMLNLKVDSLMNNHLHEVNDRLGNIEGYLFGYDKASHTGRDSSDIREE